MRLIVEKRQGNKKGRQRLGERGQREEAWLESRIRLQKRGRPRQRLVSDDLAPWGYKPAAYLPGDGFFVD